MSDQRTAPLTLLGSNISCFTVKMGNYLRLKQIPYRLESMQFLAVRKVLEREFGVMQMPVFLISLALVAAVSNPVNAESDLSGYWQHESDPVWIEIEPEAGQGAMVRNDKRPDRVGFLVVTDLEAGDDPNAWSAQVFAARLGEYRKADITLSADDRMVFTVKVGFMRRSVEWRRVSEVPPAPDDE